MKVPFHLRKTLARRSPASAVLVETGRVEALVGLLSRLGTGSWPTIHRVEGGFLVQWGEGDMPSSGWARLRRLAGNLYLPIDAELVPPLLDDEAEAFGRARGLVFGPGGRILGFDPAAPVEPSALLVAAKHQAPFVWQPFPDRPARVERLREIVRDQPAETASAIQSEPGDGDASGIGAEGPPRPEASGAGPSLVNRAVMRIGQGMVGLGKRMGSPGLARLGASWIAGAVGRVPRLTEALLGRQEGALRELLRQFQAGEIDRALRHAVPIDGERKRGQVVPGSGRLPDRDSRYSLSSLLDSGPGASSSWVVTTDIHAELARAYRKAADDAERAGDFRRAALIRGRLLNDFGAAARLLERAGLHHDAATLYLDRLRDIPNAARCFEAAGAFDRALGLYRDRRLHAEAGDLLRRLGENDEAETEYRLAARLLAEGPGYNHLAAGDLLRDRAGRPDLALLAYVQGWKARPAPNAVACVLRLARLHAERKAAGPLLGLVDQADAWFTRPGHASEASTFYNEIATLADAPGLADARDELRDRALMGLAAQLRRASETPHRPGPLVSHFVGQWTAWTPEVVADATHALSAAMAIPPPEPTYRPAPRRIDVSGYGTVSAACHAPGSGDLFLGFDGGMIVQIMLATGETRCLTDPGELRDVEALTCDVDGTTIIAVASARIGGVEIWERTLDGSRWKSLCSLPEWNSDACPSPVLRSGPFLGIAACVDRDFIVLGCDSGSHQEVPRIHSLGGPPRAARLVPAEGRVPWALLIHDGQDWTHVAHDGRVLGRHAAGWIPHRPAHHPFRSLPVSWLHVDSTHLEVAGLDDTGAVCWSSLSFDDAMPTPTSRYQGKGGPSYRAVALARPGLVAATRRGRVDWLRRRTNGLVLVGLSDLDLAEVVACFANPRTRELVAVGADGTLACLPIPD